MPCLRTLILLCLVIFFWRALSSAQELPGTPDVEEAAKVPVPLEAGAQRPEEGEEGKVEGLKPQPPFLVGSALRVGTGYSDNIFITPDHFVTRRVADEAVFVSPRATLLYPLSRAVGLVGSYRLYAQQYFNHGNSVVHSGEAFLGYRPVADQHVEIGARGGTARVSDFPQSDTNEGHFFLQGSIAPAPGSGLSASASIGLREFPERTRTEVEALTIAGLKVFLPTQPAITHKGQEDVVVSASGAFSQAITRTGGVSLGYGFASNDSDVSWVDYKIHSVSFTGLNIWRRWLYTEFGYSASFRNFGNPLKTSPPIKRRDTLQSFSFALNFTPHFLRTLPLTRSGVIRLGYDFLHSGSNVDAGEFRRSFVSLSVSLGFNSFSGRGSGNI